MAKTIKPNKKQYKSMEAALWKSCNKLRGAVELAEYEHVVLRQEDESKQEKRPV